MRRPCARIAARSSTLCSSQAYPASGSCTEAGARSHRRPRAHDQAGFRGRERTHRPAAEHPRAAREVRERESERPSVEKEIGAKAFLGDLHLEASIRRADDSNVNRIGLVPPTRSSSFSWSTRSSLACRSTGSSPISSRKRVPPCASSNRPARRCRAPVNAPFSCPKSSLSMRVGEIAAQLTLTNACPRRGLSSCKALARSSFPVPVSPRSSTVEEVGATRSRSASTRRIAVLSPTILAGSSARSSPLR